MVLNDSGDTSFTASLFGNSVSPPDDGLGIWVGLPGDVQYAARIGDPAPGIADATFLPYQLHPAAHDNLGQLAFAAGISGPGIDNSNNYAIWTGTPGDIMPAIRTGSQAAGMPAGVSYGYHSGANPIFFEPSLASNGTLAFNASVDGPGITSSNDRGIWVGQPGSPSLAAREGNAAPGTAAGVTFATLPNIVTTNSAGQVAFGATLSGSGVTNSNDTGVWLGSADNLQLVAREDSAAPGTAPGVNFAAFVGIDTSNFTPALSENGEVAFAAELRGPGITSGNDYGLFCGTAGDLHLVFQAGQQVPGEPAGTLFYGVRPDTVSINGNGDLAFLESVHGTETFTGIFATSGGVLHLLVKTGDQIDVGNGDLRTISDLRLYAGVSSGRGSGWNDAGQLVYRATFTDQSSAIIVTAVPEPSSMALALLGGAVFYLVRRRPTVISPAAKALLLRSARTVRLFYLPGVLGQGRQAQCRAAAVDARRRPCSIVQLQRAIP